MSAYPNTDAKQPGDYVVNVHPCSRDPQPGFVIESDPSLGGSLYVRTGIGSTVYGPSENWARTDTRPKWLTVEQAEHVEYQRAALAEARRVAAAGAHPAHVWTRSA